MKPELRDLAVNLPREAGPAVEIRLLEAFRRHKRQRLTRWLLATAAAASLACGVYWFTRSAPAAKPVSSRAGRALAEFVALPYSQSGVPLEHPVIVEVTAGRAELRALGVSMALVNKQGIGDARKVRADLLIGQDGVARAVRFVE